ncbi:MAG: hypothetical protein Q4B85_05765 [Lachnospiraceae bacterium]|nr:hypothetical protein [Lachnospiraceae bacterium]
MERNILISTIKDFDSHNTIRYYYSSRKQKVKFCDAMAAGEAGAKNVLSRVEIHEIIAIGSDLQAEETSNEKIRLKEGISFFASDIYAMSDFDFFRYRLAQFLENCDIEAADLYGSVEKTRQKELIARVEKEFDCPSELAFIRMSKDGELWDQVRKGLKDLTDNEMEWVKRYLYHSISSKYKVKPMTQNTDIEISFIPISRIGFDHSSMQNIARLTQALKNASDETVHLYVDMHGFSHEESFIFLSLIQALSDNPSNRIVIEEITSIGSIPKGFLYKMSNARERYKVEMLLSGINAFINFGKVDLIRDYWKNTEISNPYIDQFMHAMDVVDAGVSLCNIDELERGIRLLRSIIHEDISESITQEEESFILALRAGIINDYGPLVDVTQQEIDLLALLKWAFAKGFYQQTITIIESRLPSDIIRRGILYYAKNDEEKKAFLRALNAHHWDSPGKDRYIFMKPDHYFIKYYGRFMTGSYPKTDNRNRDYAKIRVDQVFKNQKDMLKAYSLLSDKEELLTLLTAYYDICSLRNNINHAGSSDNESWETGALDGSSLKRMYQEKLSRFIRMYSDMALKIENKKLTQCILTSEEAEEYIYSHGPKEDPDCFRVQGYIGQRERKKKRG